MKEVFDKYVDNYDMNNYGISRKYHHSYRVMELSKKYATKLGFSKHDIELATLIGLFHDIGRFEQVRKYNTFDDSKSFDHADYGNKVLFEDGLINKIWDNQDDYEIIKFAIANHNKLKIEPTTNERALMHAKLIRDTDKLDILYLEGYLKEFDLEVTDDEISEEVMKDFNNHQSILKSSRKNKNDYKVLTFSFIFDVNYDVCLDEFKNNYKYYYERLNSDKFKSIYEEVIRYIDERIDNSVRNKI